MHMIATAVCKALLSVALLAGATAPAWAAETESSIARGGRLYDKWWEENKTAKPTAAHPAYPVKGGKYANDTSWRCKECHGWDYKGKDGAYAMGAAGAVAGIVFWGGFNTAMEATNSMEFCISCHEMKDNVYQEYLNSPHYRNASGVRAICSDCHVPKEWGPKLWRKIQASNELYHHLRGTIDTPEKFEAKRAELADHVWATMIANDSHECRNCHSWDAMDHQKQTPRGAEKMQAGQKDGKTCIECHKGIAHALPKRDD